MTNTQIEVITSVERRRRWSAAEKEGLVAASLEPGATVSEVARAAGVHRSQLYGWRRQQGVRGQAPRGFAAVRLAAEAVSPVLPGAGVIEIEFAAGARMRISGAVASALLTAAVAALVTGGRQ